MRLLVFSDLHQDESALERLKHLAREQEFDYILSCGDNSPNISFLEELIDSFPRFFLIPGNWEGERANKFLQEHRNCINEKRIDLEEGLNIVGFGYSNITPFGTYGELGEDEIRKRMSKLKIDNNTILLLHVPPRGHFDFVRGEHTGSPSVLKIIEEKKPLVAFFGHIHEQSGTDEIGGTTLVKVPAANSYKAAVAEIKNKKAYVEFIEL